MLSFIINPYFRQVPTGVPTLKSVAANTKIVLIEKVNKSRPAVLSKIPNPPPEAKTVVVQHNPAASTLVKNQIASDPVAPKRSPDLIKPQPAKTTMQIPAASTQSRRPSDAKTGPSFRFVYKKKSIEADSGLESSADDAINSYSSAPRNPEKTSVSFYDPRKKEVIGRISLSEVK